MVFRPLAIQSDACLRGEKWALPRAKRARIQTGGCPLSRGIFIPPCGIIRPINPVSADISTGPAQDVSPARSRRFILSTLCIALIANALIPVVLFGQTHLFGLVAPGYRALVAAVVVAEYAIALLLLVLHANVGFASGYAVATAAVVTIGSVVLTFITLEPAGWGWSASYAEILVLAGFAFAILSNIVFVVASIRYARAIHPRLHLGGFLLGMAASLALVFLYTRILP
jgi:hypothetical protein